MTKASLEELRDDGVSTLSMSDAELLRHSLAWMGLYAPTSGDELAFGWDRHIRRLLRAITERALSALSATEEESQ